MYVRSNGRYGPSLRDKFFVVGCPYPLIQTSYLYHDSFGSSWILSKLKRINQCCV